MDEEQNHFATKYHKIRNLFRRDPQTRQIEPYEYGSEAIAYLSGASWVCQEKIDGTNTRIIWDGERVSFGTKNTLDLSNMQGKLRQHLETTYGAPEFEHLLEQEFGSTPVTIYGEGYGHKIQTGAGYFPDAPEGQNGFLAFDVRIGGRYQDPDDTAGVAHKLGIPLVDHHLPQTTIPDTVQTMARALMGEDPPLTHPQTDKEIEGFILRPPVMLYDRFGSRVMTKVLMSDINDLLRSDPVILANWFGVKV